MLCTAYASPVTEAQLVFGCWEHRRMKHRNILWNILWNICRSSLLLVQGSGQGSRDEIHPQLFTSLHSPHSLSLGSPSSVCCCEDECGF